MVQLALVSEVIAALPAGWGQALASVEVGPRRPMGRRGQTDRLEATIGAPRVQRACGDLGWACGAQQGVCAGRHRPGALGGGAQRCVLKAVGLRF